MVFVSSEQSSLLRVSYLNPVFYIIWLKGVLKITFKTILCLHNCLSYVSVIINQGYEPRVTLSLFKYWLQDAQVG